MINDGFYQNAVCTCLLTVQQSDSHVSDVVRFTCFYALIALT